MIVHFRTYIEYEEPNDVYDKADSEINLRTLSKECPCPGGYDSDFPFILTCQPIPEEYQSLKGVRPLSTGSGNPVLNGEITESEDEVFDWDDDEMYLNPKAILSGPEQLSVLRAIKGGKLPYLTLHNLSLIFKEAPRLNRECIFCILCGIRCGKILELISHIQKAHTGFVAICQICGLSYPSERSAYDHARSAHDYKGELSKSCPLVQDPHSEEAFIVGHAIAGVEVRPGQFRSRVKQKRSSNIHNDSDISAAKILQTLSSEMSGMSEADRERKKKTLFHSMMNKSFT